MSNQPQQCLRPPPHTLSWLRFQSMPWRECCCHLSALMGLNHDRFRILIDSLVNSLCSTKCERTHNMDKCNLKRPCNILKKFTWTFSMMLNQPRPCFLPPSHALSWLRCQQMYGIQSHQCVNIPTLLLCTYLTLFAFFVAHVRSVIKIVSVFLLLGKQN